MAIVFVTVAAEPVSEIAPVNADPFAKVIAATPELNVDVPVTVVAAVLVIVPPAFTDKLPVAVVAAKITAAVETTVTL